MNYIEHEFHNQGYDSIDIFYGNDFIKTINFNDKGFVGEQNKKTYIDYRFNIDSNDLILTIDLSESTILIVIEDENIANYINDSFNLNDFDFALNFKNEETQISLQIPFYMPTITYTNLASSIVYDVEDYPHTVPLFDIDSEDRFNSYIADDIILFKHFLDLEFSDKIANKEDIEAAKTIKKEARKLKLTSTTELPDKDHQRLTNEEIINSYNSLTNKTLVIPVLNWERDSHITQDIKDLEEFENIAIRISSSYIRFIDFIDTLKSEFTDKLDSFYIIFDMNNNFAIDQFSDMIIIASKIFSRVIYLGSPFSASDISKARGTETNMNHIYKNKTLEIFDSLLKLSRENDVNLYGYGDYCGFDRKSITRSTGGRPTARVVLASVDKSKKILVRRAWDNMDLKAGSTSIGLIHSMNQLMLDIQNGKLDKDFHSGAIFLNTDDYDTDQALKEFYPQRPAAGLLKTICLRHNYLSIVKNFMPLQNP
ncbi:MAG: hypothetical protein Q7S59_00465 [Sulfurimonas sp.]|nr:hypothetical protein [Sulfurimonas sp.]